MALERRIEAAHIPFRWLERGRGAPVVLVHGIPSSPELWRHVLPLVSRGRLLAWEMVGYGRSWRAGENRDISVKAQAGYLMHWLDALEVEQAVLVGHDLGGGVVQIAATRHPGRCLGIVLSNAIAYDSWPIPSVRALQLAPGLVARTPQRLLRLQLAALMHRGHEDDRVARESLEAHWPGYGHRRGAPAFARQVRSLRTEDTLEVVDGLPELRRPAALVWGAADRFQKLRYGERLAADLDASLDAVEGGRHFLPEDHPDRMAAAIDRVLAAG